MSANNVIARLAKGRRNISLVIGLSIVAALVAMALLAPLIAPYDPIDQNLARRLIPPAWMEGGSASNWLGTDHLGRDYLSRLIHGARVSLGVGFGVVLVAGAIGTTLGVVAGYFGGRVDAAITLLLTTRLAMPIVLVALAAVALVGSSMRTLTAVLALLLWDRFAVVVRATTQSLRNREFVAAARALGCSHRRVILGEVLPNLVNTLVVVATLEIAQAILLEAALSFLGLGVQAPTPSWGLMIAEGREHILFDPWLIAFPGALLFLLVLAINLLGDGLRDTLAPGQRL